VRRHLEQLIHQGAPGDKLASVRTLMADLGVSPSTVRTAVAELVRAGSVETVAGSGTFILAPPTAGSVSANRSWQTIALGSTQGEADLLAPLRAQQNPDTIDLASGYPGPSLQPTKLLAKALQDATRRPGTFGRAPSDGIGPLRDWFAEQLSPSRNHRVLIAPGGQAALSLIFRSIGLRGEAILMETPTYVGAIAAARSAGLTPVPVPTDSGGVQLGGFEAAVKASGARLCYLQPRFHNPTGATLSPERRAPLMDLASRHNLILIEDDWLYDLDLAGGHLPLAANDPDGHVVHLRSLTKSVAPALRIAGIAATGAIAERIRSLRGSEDFFVSPILQETALNVVTSPAWDRHLRRLRTELKERRLVLRRALEANNDWCLNIQGGPLHVWLETEDRIDPDELRVSAMRNGVAILSGTAWHPGDAPAKHIRLSVAAANEAEIIEGLARLQESLPT